MNFFLQTDAYKVGHVHQYPEGTQQVWSNWTGRKSRHADIKRYIHFGVSAFLQDMDCDFQRAQAYPDQTLREYEDLTGRALGAGKAAHIQRLLEHEHLPLRIWSLPEGVGVPFGVPAMVITNTEPWAYWLPNFLETRLSASIWRPSTSATLAKRLYLLLDYYNRRTGDPNFTQWQGHDFSMRGMGGVQDAILSGMGHLTSFSGTDTLPAIRAVEAYYGSDGLIGASVPATEHSVMCAGGREGELDTFRRLLKLYPTQILSVVSDTWDYWRVLREYLPSLKEEILQRPEKLVIRPDSGDPVDIMERSFLIMDEIGWPFRMNAKGYKELVNLGFIYGDGITYDVADTILGNMQLAGWSSSNIVFGVGSYTYCYNTRDTFGFAMKATAVRNVGGQIVPIYKDPVTDDGLKRSLCGIPAVFERSDRVSQDYYVIENATEDQLANCAYELVYDCGSITLPTFDEVIKNVQAANIYIAD